MSQQCLSESILFLIIRNVTKRLLLEKILLQVFPGDYLNQLVILSSYHDDIK